MTDIAKKRAKINTVEECRACLAKIQDDSLCVDLFCAWDPPWTGMGMSIAEDLAKLANIQISVYDSCSTNICKKCCGRLQDAIDFIWSVQNSDKVLRKQQKDDTNEAPSWPKPIQVDKRMASNAMNEMNIEIKQEVVTDDECDMNENCSEPIEPRLDIKIEPEEITPAPPVLIEIKGPYKLSQPAQETPTVNGGEYLDECLVQDVKEEPMSDDEMVSGMPKDCMLCMKTFNSVKGLKAHVIALHSYDTVISSKVERTNVCKICNRSFATRTDLFVHETCHSKFACYVCNQKFDTFLLLTKHRSKQCIKTGILPRLKTLDDVRRPVPVVYILDKKTLTENMDPKPASPEKPASPVAEDSIEPSINPVYTISTPELLSNIKSAQNDQKPQKSSRETSYINSQSNSCLKDFINDIENMKLPHKSTEKSPNEKTNPGVKEGKEINKTLEESIQQRAESIKMTSIDEKALGPHLEENIPKHESMDITMNTCADIDIVDSEGSNKSEQNIEQAKIISDTSCINNETERLKRYNETKDNLAEVKNESEVSNEPVEKGSEVRNETEREITCENSNTIGEKTSEVNRTENSSEGNTNTDENTTKVSNEEIVQEALMSFETTCVKNVTLEFKRNKTEENIQLQKDSEINDETMSSQKIDSNQQIEEQNQVENYEPVLPTLQNLETKINSSKSMEIQLEIHSMDKKQDDAMDIDNDLEDDIKIDASECDKSI